MLDPLKIRKDFSLYTKNPDIVYLDTNASSLTPDVVVDEISDYYKYYGVNVHRGVYQLSYQATDRYEDGRRKVANFLNAEEKEIVFTRGTSQALNLVAKSFGTANVKSGDEVITTELEHHSSMLPWQVLCKKNNAKLKYAKLNSEGRITVESIEKEITSKTKIIAVTFVSNVMGYVTPVKDIVKLAKKHNIIVVVDAAQAAPHTKIDVKDLDVDFLAFSGHKVMGPTGIGVLYGKYKHLDSMEPIEFGGDMNDYVELQSATWKSAPFKFEAGTPMIAQVIGLGKALEYLSSIGFDNIHNHEIMLRDYAFELLSKVDGIVIYNKTSDTGTITFNIDGVHPHDAASVFDQHQICIRAGHHCAQLITKWLEQLATVRASFYIYNTKKDVEKFVMAVKEAVEFFGQF